MICGTMHKLLKNKARKQKQKFHKVMTTRVLSQGIETWTITVNDIKK